MGIGYGNIMEMALGLSGFDNPGLVFNKPQVVASLTTDQYADSDNEFGANAESYFYNDSMLELLKDWELSLLIIEIFESVVSEIISTTDFEITGTKYDKEINKFLSDIGLKGKILSCLSKAMYWGNYGFYIDFQNMKLIDIMNPTGITLVKKKGEDYKYQLLGTDEVSQIITNVDSDDVESLVDYKFIGSLMFNRKCVKSVSTGSRLTDNSFLNTQLVDLSYYRGESILRKVLYLIFMHFLNTLLKFLLSLKNATKPEIVQAMVNKERSPEINIEEAINDIEACLNNGDYAFDIRSNNVLSIISTLYSSVINSVKVVPGLANYTNLEVIQIPSITDKLNQISDDIEKYRNQALQNSGVPEELVGGSSNKWETLSRNARFQKAVLNQLDDVSYCVREVACKYLNWKRNLNVNPDSLILTLDTSNYLVSNAFVSKMTVLSESLGKLSELLQTSTQLLDSQLINADLLKDYIKTRIGAIDSGLADLLVDKIKKESEDEGDEESSGSRNESPRRLPRIG